ncbi:hypothetical protein J2X98_002249 [Pseudarthrobacter enclensis]|uniref:Uncharacterized protein n=1 Tax=Pseudarthrobacter enclensis TaxID=993070 RepID=A0ABT9RV20_9MICC|nr:hypothetical protein [Pseudarthrobacter enclensis]
MMTGRKGVRIGDEAETLQASPFVCPDVLVFKLMHAKAVWCTAVGQAGCIAGSSAVTSAAA